VIMCTRFMKLRIKFSGGIFRKSLEYVEFTQVRDFCELLRRFDVCVTVHASYNNINNQLDSTTTVY